MVNMNVGYVGPNASLITLTKELTAKFGSPKRTYEFVTGYKSASNITSHNADNNGKAHAVDIFVGAGQSISEVQGIDLAERLRVEGTKGTIAGHPDRLAYIIHNRRIAGDHTGWKWITYTGADPHTDHIHVSSVFDFFWGDPIWEIHVSNYENTTAWNLWAGAPASPAPKPAVKPAVKPAAAKPAVQTGLVNRYVTNDNAYLLTRPTTAAPTYAVFPKGTPLAIKGYVGGQDPYGTGDTAWYVTGSGHYVWANAAEDNVAGLRFLGNM